MEGKQQELITLSVIVPCYNVGPYLDRSLLSLSQQWNGRTDYEIILVDDASTDNTLSKLVLFKEKYPNNVILIEKKNNEGVAAARNSALDLARGQWITMFDPDDALAIGGYDYLIKNYATNDVDIVSFGAFTMKENNAPKLWNKELLISNETPVVMKAKDFMLSRHIGSSIIFLFNNKLLKSHRYPYLSLLEDIVFNLPLFLSDNKVIVAGEKIYYYLTRNSSATNTLDIQRLNIGCDDILFAIKTIENLRVKEDKKIDNTLRVYQNRYSRNLFTRLLLSSKTIKQISKFRNELKELNLYPFNKNEDWSSNKNKLYNYLFKHPLLMIVFRWVYRFHRR